MNRELHVNEDLVTIGVHRFTFSPLSKYVLRRWS